MSIPKNPLPTARLLLAWYDRQRRRLPWRAEPGQVTEPYRVWLSEIMLQQTTVATVTPYFERFLARWPTLAALAAADLDEVLHAWQGLGYYARARNLHRCARLLSLRPGGFPESEPALRALPGIGEYTAAAIAAIAFGHRATPVDGNVLRVMARVFGIAAPLPRAKNELARLARALTPVKRTGDYAQAVMDLGATVCTPRAPDCDLCPWRRACIARREGCQEALPARGPRRARPTRHGVVYWLLDGDDRVLLRRRPEQGLLGGMMEMPSSEWRERPWPETSFTTAAPRRAAWRRLPGSVRHVFTHFELELVVLAARLARPCRQGLWWPVGELDRQALPTLMRKVARHALAGGDVPIRTTRRAVSGAGRRSR